MQSVSPGSSTFGPELRTGVLAGTKTCRARLHVPGELVELAAQNALQECGDCDDRAGAVGELAGVERLQRHLVELVGTEPREHMPDVMRLPDPQPEIVHAVARRHVLVEVGPQTIRVH